MNKMQKEKTPYIIGIIPARYNSSRFPGKPLALIGKKTLIQRTYENAFLSPILDNLYVASDDKRILSHVISFSSKEQVLVTSSNCSTGTERVRDALIKYPILQKSKIVINIQGDHPNISKNTITSVINALHSDDDCMLATAVIASTSIEDAFSPHVVKCIFNNEYKALYFSRQLIPYHYPKTPISFYQHLGIYAYRTDFLINNFDKMKKSYLQENENLEQLLFLQNGYNIKVSIVKEKSMGIDIPEDIKKMEKVICQ